MSGIGPSVAAAGTTVLLAVPWAVGAALGAGEEDAAAAPPVVVAPVDGPALATSTGGAAITATADMFEAEIAATGTSAESPAGDVACTDQAVTADGLNAAFDAGIDGMVGADYQRTFELDDGRVLWVFQDVFIDDGRGAATLVHNAGMVQDGMCFDVMTGGSDTAPDSWIGASTTDPFVHWYWPLDGYQADDDTFVLFVAEMDEQGGHYLANATPVSTMTVEIDLDTFEIGELERAPNPDDRLYGFEVTTDDEYLYLYAQCHRQFGFSAFGHDDCAADVYVARQPLGAPNVPLEYWTGSGWSRNSRRAVNVAPSEAPDGTPRTVNPMQIERAGAGWIAVTKAGDWWGDAVYFDVALDPTGPWITTAVLPVTPQGDPDEVATYFVSFVPTDEFGSTVAVSNNRWDGEFSDVYHPHVVTVPLRLWLPREAVQIGDTTWLPTGDRLW